jgi:transcriptional regulator with XRE-family HTH domain
MDLLRWLQACGISQRELARRVGYESNGPLSKIIKGEAYVPPDQVPRWADALELKGAKRDAFFEECSKDSIPDWTREKLRDLQRQVRELEAAVEPLTITLRPLSPAFARAVIQWVTSHSAAEVAAMLVESLSANARLIARLKNDNSPLIQRISRCLEAVGPSPDDVDESLRLLHEWLRTEEGRHRE